MTLIIYKNTLSYLRKIFITLQVNIDGRKKEVSTELIKEVMITRKRRPIGRGLLVGALGEATIGALIGFVTYQEPEPGSWSLDFGPGFAAGAVRGFLGGAIAGTIMGATSNRYIHYDFSTI